MVGCKHCHAPATYGQSPKNKKGQMGQLMGFTLFKLPFEAKMEYVDMAVNQLLMLGIPFFRSTSPSQAMKMDDFDLDSASKLNNVLFTRGTLNVLDDGGNQSWLTGEHIHFAYRW